MTISTDVFSGHDHLNDEGVALYVDALTLGKTDALPPPVRDHVAECLHCKRAITDLHAMLHTGPAITERPHPSLSPAPRGWIPIPHTVFRAAAILAVVILGGIGVYLFVIKAPPAPTMVGTHQPTDSVLKTDRSVDIPKSEAETRHPADPASQQYAANFAVDPNLEDLVDVDVRSRLVNVTAPRPGYDARGEVLFQWKTLSQDTFILSILDNRGNVVHTVSQVSSPVLVKKSFTPGLYYWKLETDNEVLYVGKFYVGRK